MRRWRYATIPVATVGVFLVLAAVGLLANTAHAEENLSAAEPTCSSGITGTSERLPADTYTVYVQLAKRGQQAPVSLSMSSQGQCTTVGSTNATGDTYTRIGIATVTTDAELITFLLNSDQVDETVSANRPSVLLVSSTHSVCTPSPDCVVKVGNTQGVILPSSNAITDNALRVSRVVDPEQDTIKKVTYYVNERPVYTTKSLEAFDLRYVSLGNERLNRVIEYTSGQRISIGESVPLSYSDSFFNFIFRIYHSNPWLFVSASIVLLLYVAISVSLFITHAIVRRHYWELAHGFAQQKQSTHSYSMAQIDRTIRIKKILKNTTVYGGVGISIIVVALFVNFNVVTLYQVKGVSMTNTFANKSHVIVNRLPISIAKANNQSFVPERGQVVILNAAYGLDSDTEETKGYIIKRVLGLPGERVTIINNIVTIYKTDGSVVEPDKNAPWSTTMITSDSNESIDITLTSNELFISGDNRVDSIDSRFNGPISTDEVIGVVGLKLW